MRTFLKILLLTFFISLVTCKGQNKNTMIEKFDFEVYKKTEYGENRYLKNDGFEIIEMAFIKDKKGFQREFEPKPSFKKIYKRFYGNGNLNSKETYIGENVKIGISEYYNEDGTLDKKVNEDEKFGKIKYTDCLAFLEKKGYIDLKTGKGREDKDERPLFELYFNDEKGHKSWVISIIKGKPNNLPPDHIGEPLDALPLDFIMDGETGKITEEK